MERFFLLIRPLLYIYVFLLPFEHFAAVRNTAFVAVLLIFLIKAFREGLRIDFRDRTVIALGALVAVSLLSALLSNYPVESLHAMRKNIFYQLVIFLVIVSEFKGMDDLRPLFYTMMASLAALTVLILASNEPKVLVNWLDYHDKKFTKGFSLHATFYIPLLLGYLFATEEGAVKRFFFCLFLFIAFILSVLNNHRVQIAAIVISALATTLIVRRFRLIAIGGAVCVAAGLLLFTVKPDIFDRYKTLFSPRTYMTSEYSGWNGRFPIWSGTIDMIRDRPVLGHGYGWKKIARVARDGGYLERWDRNSGPYMYFSSMDYGSASPHNLVLQILFEVGLLGLVAFVYFWFTVIKKILHAFRAGLQGEAAGFLRYAATGVLISYFIVNIPNGLWEEIAGNLMMAFAACTVVLYREAAVNTGMVRDESP